MNDLFNIINVSIVGVLLLVAIFIFLDARKNKKSYFQSLIWGIIALCFFPPVGIAIYFFYKKRNLV